MADREKIFPALQVNLFGGLTLSRSDFDLSDDENRSQKMWSVLAYFIVNRDRAIPQRELFSEFWSEKNVTNPHSALKTILYRLRPMLTDLAPPDSSAIVSTRGAYTWNASIPCELDIDRFSNFFEQAKSPSLEISLRLEHCQAAMSLYTGRLLPKQQGQSWVDILSAHYHKQFCELVKLSFHLLEQEGKYEEMDTLCRQACEIDPLNEGFRILYIRSLLYRGHPTQALDEYEKTVTMLYRKLGAAPSEELRNVYGEVRNAENGAQNDLLAIQEDLHENASRSGAFLCEYSFLREFYRLEARRAQRSGNSVHMALLTVSLPGGKEPDLGHLNNTMDYLLPIIQNSLRSGDVVARYSYAQYVIMLPDADFRACVMIMDRILAAFRRQYRHNNLRLGYRILDPDEGAGDPQPS